MMWLFVICVVLLWSFFCFVIAPPMWVCATGGVVLGGTACLLLKWK